MARSSTPYGEMRSTGVRFEGVNPDIPVAGLYITRMRSGGALCALRIWYGAPLDPVTGEELDRSHGWNALLNEHESVDIERIWPSCAADLTTRAKYEAVVRRSKWARENASGTALANPYRKADPLTDNLLF
ncbi:hypothetical protein AB1K62_14555 [Parasphingorhabdus sp. JC815]|uniref:hypothetical protein n=1 Tax=Parasphingorhabdus sp. JC815 TaxID=3232140 RepID=UPI00345B2024